MKKIFFSILLLLPVCGIWAQNSVLVNFGSPTCVNVNQPSFSLLKNPLSAASTVVTQCALNSQIPNIYGVFIAYNPKDNNIYIADVRNFTQSNIWKLDVGLPDSIRCPATIPIAPTYSHNYVSNNFEFDNSGNLWSFASFDAATGRCNLDKLDVVNGNIINSRIIQFPVGNYPGSITSGDLCILPNGRMFATLGTNPSRLYEFGNYAEPGTVVQAKYLQTMPKNCFGIAYLNGLLEVTGTDLSSSCYFFTYDIVTNTLSTEKPFQNGQGSIDNTSITPSIGTTKRVVEATPINFNTAIVTYEVHLRNMGNTVLNDINIAEDLVSVFGETGLIGVTANFVSGSNGAGLTLNPGYNGRSDKMLLKPDQSLPNFTGSNGDYFCTIQLQVVITNLLASKVYLNSALASATINGAADKIIITDSSNNGMPDAIDPNQNGNPTEAGENEPTPFGLSLLPVNFISFKGRLTKPTTTELTWIVSTPTTGADFFEIQYSTHAANWKTAGIRYISDYMQRDYTFLHNHDGSGQLFYRLKQVDKDGKFVFSQVVTLQQVQKKGLSIYPNPASEMITIGTDGVLHDNRHITIYDMQGRICMEQVWSGRTVNVSVKALPTGNYRVLFTNGQIRESKQITIIR
jgi:hypothetical protein